MDMLCILFVLVPGQFPGQFPVQCPLEISMPSTPNAPKMVPPLPLVQPTTKAPTVPTTTVPTILPTTIATTVPTTVPTPSVIGATTKSVVDKYCIRVCPVTFEYNPVCGSNGITYDNPSRLNCAWQCGVDVTLVRNSACPPTTVTFIS